MTDWLTWVVSSNFCMNCTNVAEGLNCKGDEDEGASGE